MRKVPNQRILKSVEKTPGDFNTLRDRDQNTNGVFKGDGGLCKNKTGPHIKIMQLCKSNY